MQGWNFVYCNVHSHNPAWVLYCMHLMMDMWEHLWYFLYSFRSITFFVFAWSWGASWGLILSGSFTTVSIRACSQAFHHGGEHYTVSYVPGESSTYVFGCNSNWRGPIWLCGKWSGGVVPSSLAQMIVALTLLLYTFLFLLTHFFCLTTFSVYHHTPEQFS